MGTGADITDCRSCGSAHLDVFLRLGDMPLSDGLRTEEQLGEEEARHPLDVAVCGECTLVQILRTVPPEVLFDDDYPYYSSFSDELVAHARSNVEARIAELGLGPEDLVVELASNDGYLLQHYVERGVDVLGIDPAKGPVEAARERGVPTLHAFFSRALADELVENGRRARVVHGNNVLAHVADTNGFVAGIARLLADDGVAVFEVPYVRDLIEHVEFDTIYHEHLCYFSVHALRELLARHGLRLVRVERLAIHGGSLRVFAAADGPVHASVDDVLDEEDRLGMTGRDYYDGFSERVRGVRDELRRLLGELRAAGATVAGYGAAAKGAVLLNYVGVGRDDLAWVADRNVHKQGRYMPGVHVPIVSPDRIREEPPDVLLILPWNFKDEIMAQQSEFAERGGRFLVPIPRPTLVEPAAASGGER